MVRVEGLVIFSRFVYIEATYCVSEGGWYFFNRVFEFRSEACGVWIVLHKTQHLHVFCK